MGDWKGGEQPQTELDPNAEGVELPTTLQLSVCSGPDKGKAIELSRGIYLVGKTDKCDLVLSDRRVSREHLEVTVSSNEIVIRDLGSRNGSTYEGARFVEVKVGVGAIVALGSTELRVVSARVATTLAPSERERFGDMLGKSLTMRQAFAVLERVAPSDAAVLIQGETGTGKEVCANAIHAGSRRADKRLVVCDLGAVSPTLIESELFGHKRGAFTGADTDRIGAFEHANGGTLFLDEVGELPLDLQPRLMRALDQRRVKPIGDSNYRDIDVRIIAATNRNLEKECREGRFRKDLMHRLAVVTVVLPPLRHRRGDLPLLAEEILAGTGVTLKPESQALLASYDWPGNVRELRNVLTRALSLRGKTDVLTPESLGIEPSRPGTEPAGLDGFHERKEHLIATWERDYLTELLKSAGGNVSRASRKSGLDRAYLHRLIKKHGIGAVSD